MLFAGAFLAAAARLGWRQELLAGTVDRYR